MDQELLKQLLQLPKDCDERREILALMDCHFMSTAMLRISQTPPEQEVVLERRLSEIVQRAHSHTH